MKTIKFVLNKNFGKFKILNATNGGLYAHDVSVIFPNFELDETSPDNYDFTCTEVADFLDIYTYDVSRKCVELFKTYDL